ncbi:hypothetical protein TNIN_133141 [Trichonephila inaurata madagascariensis]|uniref:Uncharacterized protein n=1 Tax=Trichonephila inaurata madagascariensis TaxID=2747483 RepID=A0A8X7BX94_9ARAC|nr:hypothetical protein TNIN_133141 [Trichonephila inaurata madagascariensis]
MLIGIHSHTGYQRVLSKPMISNMRLNDGQEEEKKNKRLVLVVLIRREFEILLHQVRRESIERDLQRNRGCDEREYNMLHLH